MALIDAACQAAGLGFFAAARADAFGLVRHCPADLEPNALAASLTAIRPVWSVCLRHTIGAGGALTADEVGDRPADGLPVSVDEVIAATGISAFKVKLSGSVAADIDRLRAVAAVLDRVNGYAVTLDANEQYTSDAFASFLEALRGEPALARFRGAVRFVEQPFAREEALRLDAAAFGDARLVIDESDDHDGAFPAALARGWAGTSVKSCKGVLRALVNRARAAQAGAILTGEDLTCQPGLCWQQDTLMAAACGVADVERNGHHFAGGMQGAPVGEVATRLAAHPDIYRSAGERPALAIANGRVHFASLDKASFGDSADVDLTGAAPLGRTPSSGAGSA
jgi:hypothetical protein